MRFLCSIFLAGALALSSQTVIAAKTLNQAVRQVERQTDGRILSANTVRRGDRLVHRIKVLTKQGHVRVITVDGGPVDERRRKR